MGWSGIKDYGFGSKNRTKEQDDEYRKRIGGVPRKRVWSDDRIHNFIDEMLDLYKRILMDDAKVETNSAKKLKAESIKDLNTMVRRLLDFKEAYYPTVQKSINVNIDTTADKVIERIKKHKISQGEILVSKDDTKQEEEKEPQE